MADALRPIPLPPTIDPSRDLDDLNGCVVTVGRFDGVHRGHAKVIATALDSGRSRGAPVVVVVLDALSAELQTGHPQLTTVRRRVELIRALGVDAVLVLLDADKFAADLNELLVRLNPVEVVCGDWPNDVESAVADPTSWSDTREGTPLAVRRVWPATVIQNGMFVAISSSFISLRIAAGDVASATKALGRPHRVDGTVVHGHGRGRHMGFPTANVDWSENAAIPADGVYACWFTANGDPGNGARAGMRYQAAVSVGTNPTFAGARRTVEAYVLDASVNLYDMDVSLDFVERIRGQLRFDAAEELIVAMRQDSDRTRSILCASARLLQPTREAGV